LARLVVRTAIRIWFRPRVAGRANVPAEGPVVVAPVHRSFADFVFPLLLTDRKLFYMGKDTLWRSRAFGRLLSSLGAFPVHRQAADREALARAEEVLRRGQVLVLFPEGTRQEGAVVGRLREGAARTGAPIVPVGIGGSDQAMPRGHVVPRPRRVTVVAGPALQPPKLADGARRVPLGQVRRATEELRLAIQAVYDEARR
jgi:1-acyl-sn-glycerol-3-phosphate acyltransferase